MKQLYNRRFSRKWATGESTRVYSEQVPTGHVLHVHQCFAYAPERENNDDILIGISNGGEELLLLASTLGTAQRGAEVANHFDVGEGFQLFADFPDVDNTDTIAIDIFSTLYPIDEWLAVTD